MASSQRLHHFSQQLYGLQKGLEVHGGRNEKALFGNRGQVEQGIRVLEFEELSVPAVRNEGVVPHYHSARVPD